MYSAILRHSSSNQGQPHTARRVIDTRFEPSFPEFNAPCDVASDTHQAHCPPGAGRHVIDTYFEPSCIGFNGIL